MTVALANGGLEHFGWGQDRHLTADLFDAIRENTRATGQWRKPPKLEQYPRPKPKKKAARHKNVSVKALYAMFAAGAGAQS